MSFEQEMDDVMIDLETFRRGARAWLDANLERRAEQIRDIDIAPIGLRPTFTTIARSLREKGI